MIRCKHWNISTCPDLALEIFNKIRVHISVIPEVFKVNVAFHGASPTTFQEILSTV